MKTQSLFSLTLAALLLAAPVASAQEDDHEAHHPEAAEPGDAPAAPEGMMGQGMMGEGMMEQRGMSGMTPDAMPREGMGPGMTGQRRMGGGMMMGGDPLLYGSPHGTPEEMTPERVRELLEQRLDYHGNPRLELGQIIEADDGSITAEIVTVDGSLVQKLAFNRYPGLVRQITD